MKSIRDGFAAILFYFFLLAFFFISIPLYILEAHFDIFAFKQNNSNNIANEKKEGKRNKQNYCMFAAYVHVDKIDIHSVFIMNMLMA